MAMTPTAPRHAPAPARALAVALALLGGLVACGGTNPSAAPGSAGASGPVASGPVGSGTAACPTAPTPPDDLAGWGPPATAPELTPYLIAGPGQLVCGPNRILFTLLDKDGRPAGAPDRPVKVDFYNLGRDPNARFADLNGLFVWAIEGERGIYVTNVEFPEAGRYGAEFTFSSAGTVQSLRLTFDVQPSSPVVKVGDRAPASKTPTLADVGGDVARISTDTDPDPRLYETSVDQALAEKRPFVLAFATPRFCTSAQCGPTLERLKPFLDRYPTVTFINVEPYKLKEVDGALALDLDANGQLQAATVTQEWRLFNEPAVYVVDREGVVRASFELIFSDEELAAALDAVQ